MTYGRYQVDLVVSIGNQVNIIRQPIGHQTLKKNEKSKLLRLLFSGAEPMIFPAAKQYQCNAPGVSARHPGAWPQPKINRCDMTHSTCDSVRSQSPQTTQSHNRARRPVKPVHGICRWIRKLVLPHGIGTIAINGVEYDVEAQLNIDDQVMGFRLVKTDDTEYRIDTSNGSWRCTCMDAICRSDRPGGCKHVAAMKAATQSLPVIRRPVAV